MHVVGPFDDIEGASIHQENFDVPFGPRIARSIASARLIRRLKPDVVILEGPTLPVGLGAGSVIQMIHDSKFATQHRRRGGWLLWAYYFFICRLSDFVMTVSEAEKRRITESLRIASDRILVSYNGINEAWLADRDVSCGNQFDLLYVSNFAKHKGHIRLLESLVDAGLNIAFVGGDLGTLEQVQDFVTDNGLKVSFFKGLSEEALIDLYDRSRVFVFPSELEGFGIPFLEARARGLPVVASDLEVFRELAAKIGGHIVDFDDHEAVASMITHTLDEPRNRPNLVEFTWKNLAVQLNESFFRN